MSRRLMRTAALLCVLLLVGGCGKKGRLYIPQESGVGAPVVSDARVPVSSQPG